MSTLGRTHAIDAVLNKTGLWTAVKGKAISNFEEPELLDDLLDHWTSDFHAKVVCLMCTCSKSDVEIFADWRSLFWIWILGFCTCSAR